MRGWAVLLAVLLLPAAGIGGGGIERLGQLPGLVALEGATSDLRLPDRIHLYVAVPGDQEVRYAIADAALHEAELALGWLEGQVGERWDRRASDFAEIVPLRVPAASLQGDPHDAFELIMADVRAHADDPAVFPLVLADVTTAPSPEWRTCGLGGVRGLVMFLGNCPDDDLSTTSTWGSAASRTIAHELVHGLGGVAACAPHATDDGHVVDDPSDLMAAARGRDPHVVLDAGRDDYLDHGVRGCPDIRDSPLWR